MQVKNTGKTTKIAQLPIKTAEKTKLNANYAAIKQKNNIIPIIASLLVLFTIKTNALPINTENNSFKVEYFNKPPLIYFEQVANAHMSNTEWNIIAFIDLNDYEKELTNLQQVFSTLKTICNKNMWLITDTDSCNSYIQTLKEKYANIKQTNELIHNDHIRYKRATLDVIGDIAGDLFGVLGSRFAKQYAVNMDKLMANDEHLLELIHGQTSVLDATTNIIKKTESDIFAQNKIINNQSLQIQKIGDIQEATQKFTLLSLQVTNILNKYENQQEAIVHVLTL